MSSICFSALTARLLAGLEAMNCNGSYAGAAVLVLRKELDDRDRPSIKGHGTDCV